MSLHLTPNFHDRVHLDTSRFTSHALTKQKIVPQPLVFEIGRSNHSYYSNYTARETREFRPNIRPVRLHEPPFGMSVCVRTQSLPNHRCPPIPRAYLSIFTTLLLIYFYYTFNPHSFLRSRPLVYRADAQTRLLEAFGGMSTATPGTHDCTATWLLPPNRRTMDLEVVSCIPISAAPTQAITNRGEKQLI